MKEFLKRNTSGGAGSGSVAGEFKQCRYGPAVKGKRKKRRLREEQRVVEAFSGVRQSAELLRDVYWLWDNAGGDRLTAKSFWIGRDDTPRCSIEAFALECAFFHCPDFLGAEFWVQIRDGADGDEGGLDFHFDKDEALMATQDIWCHPHTSTVTYLHPEVHTEKVAGSAAAPRWGAPLVVFQTTSYESAAMAQLQPTGALPRRAWALFPRPGNHVKFAGNLLHGVPSELNEHLYSSTTAGQCGDIASDPGYERISLMVNIWTHCHPDAVKRLSHESIDEMQSIVPAKFETVDKVESVESQQFFNLDSLQPESFCATPLPALSSDEDLKVLDRDTLPPDFDASQVFFLREHVDGSTAHLPLGILKSELQKCRDQASDNTSTFSTSNAGLKMTYF